MSAQTPNEAGLAILEQAAVAANLARVLTGQALDLFEQDVLDQKVTLTHRHARLPAERLLEAARSDLHRLTRDLEAAYSTVEL